MTRWQAAKRTALIVAVLWLFGVVLDRWPYQTLGGLTIVSVYRTLREMDDNPVSVTEP